MVSKATSRIVRWDWPLFLPRFGCRYLLLPVRNIPLVSVATICLLLILSTHRVYAIQLNSDVPLATAGYFQLTWTDELNPLQLQESSSPEFTTYKTIYEGNDLARVMSGKSNGNYYYRLISTEENHRQTSNLIKVTVSHHSLFKAFLFLIAGAIVFVATLILIIMGSRQKS